MQTTHSPRPSAPPSARVKFGILRRFATSETGAVTADWVVLSFGLATLGLLCVASIGVGVIDVAVDVAAMEAPSAVLNGGK